MIESVVFTEHGYEIVEGIYRVRRRARRSRLRLWRREWDRDRHEVCGLRGIDGIVGGF